MALSNTSLNEDCSVLAAKASLWMLQCVKTAFGATDCIRVTTPLCLPVIAQAPSEQTPTHFSHEIPFCSMKSINTLNISTLVGCLYRGLQKQNKKSSIISSHVHIEHILVIEENLSHLCFHRAELQKNGLSAACLTS